MLLLLISLTDMSEIVVATDRPMWWCEFEDDKLDRMLSPSFTIKNNVFNIFSFLSVFCGQTMSAEILSSWESLNYFSIFSNYYQIPWYVNFYLNFICGKYHESKTASVKEKGMKLHTPQQNCLIFGYISTENSTASTCSIKNIWRRHFSKKKSWNLRFCVYVSMWKPTWKIHFLSNRTSLFSGVHVEFWGPEESFCSYRVNFSLRWDE